MKCPVCNSQMKPCSGKHGDFFSCRDHGTLSFQGPKVFCSGDIYKKFSAGLQVKAQGFISVENIDLEFETRKQAASFGVDITELDRFIEGDEDAANDEPDHWMNVRPY